MPEERRLPGPATVAAALAAGAVSVLLAAGGEALVLGWATGRALDGDVSERLAAISKLEKLRDAGVPALLKLSTDPTPVPLDFDPDGYSMLVMGDMPETVGDLALDALRRLRLGRDAARTFEWDAASGVGFAYAYDQWRNAEIDAALEWWSRKQGSQGEVDGGRPDTAPLEEHDGSDPRAPGTTARPPGEAAQARAQPDGAPERFTIATYNVYWENPDLARTVEVIGRTGADLVALQETNPASERALRRALGATYPHMAFRRGRLGTTAAFLSKAPLREVRYLCGENDPRGAYLCEVTLGGREVAVADVHLEPMSDRAPEGAVEGIGLFLKTEGARVEQLRRAVAELPAGVPAIVVGDFNAPAPLAAGTFLRTRGFVDSFASVVANPEAHATWRDPGPGAGASFRVDLVFHSREMRTSKSEVVKDGPSDHWPVVSVLEWVTTSGATSLSPDGRTPRGP